MPYKISRFPEGSFNLDWIHDQILKQDLENSDPKNMIFFWYMQGVIFCLSFPILLPANLSLILILYHNFSFLACS